MPQLVAVFGPARERLYANRPALEYLGTTLTEWQRLGDRLWFFHPDDRDRVAHDVSVGPDSDVVPHEFEARIRRNDGTYRWFLCRDNPVRDARGRLVRWYLSATDIEDRKRVEDELRESEMRFRAFVDHAADAFCIFDEQRRIIEVNREACDSLGYRREEVIGMTPADFDPDVDAALLRRIDEEIASDRICTFETRQRRKDGTVYPVEVRVRPLQLGGRRLHLASARNITERKRAEDERRQSTERFRAIADYTYDWENWFGIDGKLLWVNPAVERITGYSVDECMAMADFFIPIVAEADRDVVASQTREAIEGSSGNDFEFRVRRKDGRPVWVAASWQPIYDARGSRLGYRSSIRDIPMRKRAEERLRTSEAYLAEAQRLTHTGSWAFDVASNRYVYLSEECCRIFEFDPKAGLPTREAVSEMIFEDDWDRVNSAFDKALRERTDVTSDFRVTTPSGTVKHVLASRHPVFDDAGELVQLVGTVVDITERRRAEEVLRQSEDERRRAELAAQSARAELEHVSRVMAIGELAASLAHEITQPLAGVITSANAGVNWLAGDPPNLAKARESLARIVRDGTRAGEVVSRIRSAVKRAPSLKQRVNVNDIVREVLKLVHGDLLQHAVAVAVVLDPAVPDVVGDSVQLQQVVLNIVNNGLEAIADVEGRSGTLRIESAPSELDGTRAVRVSVGDNGTGFGMSDPETLFEAFRTTKPHGMGMGLWISRWIVERHHGRLTAHANDGPGATFRVLLPAADGDAV